MKDKEDFFTNEKLISQLISYRAKKAKGNHDLLISQSYLSKRTVKKENIKFLCQIRINFL